MSGGAAGGNARLRVKALSILGDVNVAVEIADTRRVVRCPHCGFKTNRVHDRRQLRVTDLPTRGRPTTLMWVRRRFLLENVKDLGRTQK